MDYLVFQLYGAMASWGQAAVGGDRPTAAQPTRSAIIGLIAAALGIKRDQEDLLQTLQRSLWIGIKQCAPSSIIRDYHTTQVPSARKKHRYYTRKDELNAPSLNTVLSSRDYRCDGLWVIALSLSDNADVLITLDRLANALTKPVFTLYLGRKSCPLGIPIQPKRLQTNTLRAALDHPFPPLTADNSGNAADTEKRYLLKTNSARYFWEGNKQALGVADTDVITCSPWDEPVHRGRWQFKQRTEYQYTSREMD